MSNGPVPTFQIRGLWVAVTKPAGWLTIDGSRAQTAQTEPRPVLKSWLEDQLAQKIWVVHRIDLQTSGIVLFALNADAHRQASVWFEKHQVRKAYDFLAQGEPRLPVMKVDKPIEGARSVTQLEVKERFTACFLDRAIPHSGRRHQIRIHLADLKHPILGDTQYGGKAALGELTIQRVALHAARLELPDGQKFEAPWPEDFQSWVTQLRAKLS